MANQNVPLVTMALPLYKSRRFLDIITKNLETIDYPNLEILISDRHCADDAIDVLQTRFANDARFRFFRARDELNWVEHYNFLLRAAEGTFFIWTPHDDTFPPDYVRVLVHALESNPDAMIAVGGMEALYSDGTRRMFRPGSPCATFPAPGLRSAFAIYLQHIIWLPFHGVMRRAQLLENGLVLRPTRDTIAADLLWDYAAALSGKIIFVQDCHYQKRYYAESTHAGWHRKWSWRHLVAEFPALRDYLVPPHASLRTRARAWSAIAFWAAVRGGGILLAKSDVVKKLEPLLRSALLFAIGSRPT